MGRTDEMRNHKGTGLATGREGPRESAQVCVTATEMRRETGEVGFALDCMFVVFEVSHAPISALKEAAA